VAVETLADTLAEGPLPDGWPRATVALGGADVTIALRRRSADAS
jgi:hypothetical protein